MKKTRRMSARQYLESYKLLDTKIRQRERQIAELRERAQSIASPKFDGEHVDNSGSRSARFESAIDDARDLEIKVEALRDKMLSQKNEILTKIQKLDKPEYVELLEQRYIYFKSWSKVTKAMREDGMFYAEEYISGILHQKALRAFEKSYSKR